MFVGIVYESLFGNTREIAEAVAAGIRDADPEAGPACLPVAEAGPELARAGLLIAGAPTHFLGLPSPRSRIMQLRYRTETGRWDITGPLPRQAAKITGARPGTPGRTAPQPRPDAPAGMREWLEQLPRAARGTQAAAFDTRLEELTAGSAAREIGHALRERGYQLAARPEGFTVADFEGPLAEGEQARARQWGAEAYRAALRAAARRQ